MWTHAEYNGKGRHTHTRPINAPIVLKQESSQKSVVFFFPFKSFLRFQAFRKNKGNKTGNDEVKSAVYRRRSGGDADRQKGFFSFTSSVGTSDRDTAERSYSTERQTDTLLVSVCGVNSWWMCWCKNPTRLSRFSCCLLVLLVSSKQKTPALGAHYLVWHKQLFTLLLYYVSSRAIKLLSGSP